MLFFKNFLENLFYLFTSESFKKSKIFCHKFIFNFCGNEHHSEDKEKNGHEDCEKVCKSHVFKDF